MTRRAFSGGTPVVVAATVAALLLVLASSYGCGRRPPRTRYYVLEPTVAAQADDDSNPHAADGLAPGIVIGVETFHIDSPYDEDRIVYRVGEDTVEIGFYDYHRWAAPLSRMLPRIVAGVLDGIEGAARIEPAQPGRDYSLRIVGRVLVLEEVDTAEGARVRLRLWLGLVQADGSEIWSETVTEDCPVGTRTVAAVVEAMRVVMERALREMRPGLARVMPGTP